MRTGAIAAVIVLSAQGWASTNAVAETGKQPVGLEAFRVLASFYDYDRHVPLDASVVEKQELPGCTREKIVFRVRGSWAVGYLAIPKTGSPPFPCVFGLHGIGGSKMDFWESRGWESGQNMTRALLESGIAVFTPDAQHHGERIADFGFKSPAAMVFEQRWSGIRDLLVHSVIECRRGVDYLEAREEIDAKRIGAIGYSLGGMETFALLALDDRFRVGVACVTPAGTLEGTGKDQAFAPRNFAARIEGRPLLMQMGKSDPFCNEAQARHLFELIPGNRKELVFYDSGHMISPEHESKAAKWLRDALK